MHEGLVRLWSPEKEKQLSKILSNNQPCLVYLMETPEKNSNFLASNLLNLYLYKEINNRIFYITQFELSRGG